ncbi:S24 family peptidase [Pelobacter propionicus]|uniref:Putative phage repressor n=1 Tax=Pelobacter propionicus (strain DSM 2379 / NBRC 103807 / OttBd1) TaxID=338966 RepID=A1ARM1_PELPD|nr:S24 family peptidase [Pelobacter propionicus]ABK99991.1 putative phage repressor [Pelobacter propionicus DSM 2379]
MNLPGIAKHTGFTHTPPEGRFLRRICESDCMEPHIYSGDVVVIDTEVRNINEGVFMLHFGGSDQFKRLQPVGDNAVNVICDNPHYGNEACASEVLKPLIVGRVVAITRMERTSLFEKLVHQMLNHGEVMA